MGTDVVKIIEAAYRMEGTEQAWLAGALEVVEANLDRGMGCSAFFYDASNVDKMRLWSFIGGSKDKDDPIMRAIEKSSPERVRWTFRGQACRTASEGPDWENQPAAKLFRNWGVEDVLFVNGLDPSGIGCFFTARLGERRRSSPSVTRRWSRLAVHLAAGLRLRRRLETDATRTLDSAAAIATPSGKIVHAKDGAVSKSAQNRLRDAVLAVERSRGPLRRRNPDEAVEFWRGLVSGHWSLVEEFDSDGRRFLVARSNEPAARGPNVLTDRERQILGYASMGHHPKLIAYELGISWSTVRVLMSRAYDKLGAKTRDEALAAFARLAED